MYAIQTCMLYRHFQPYVRKQRARPPYTDLVLPQMPVTSSDAGHVLRCRSRPQTPVTSSDAGHVLRCRSPLDVTMSAVLIACVDLLIACVDCDEH